MAIEFDLRPNSGLLLSAAAGQCAPNGFVCIQVHHAQITRKKRQVYPPAAASKLNPILIPQFEAWTLGKSCVYLVESLITNVYRRGKNLPKATILGEELLSLLLNKHVLRKCEWFYQVYSPTVATIVLKYKKKKRVTAYWQKVLCQCTFL